MQSKRENTIHNITVSKQIRTEHEAWCLRSVPWTRFYWIMNCRTENVLVRFRSLKNTWELMTSLSISLLWVQGVSECDCRSRVCSVRDSLGLDSMFSCTLRVCRRRRTCGYFQILCVCSLKVLQFHWHVVWRVCQQPYLSICSIWLSTFYIWPVFND